MRFEAGIGRAAGIRGRALGESGVGIGSGLSTRYGGGGGWNERRCDEGVGDAGVGECWGRVEDGVSLDGEPRRPGVDNPPRGAWTRLGVDGPEAVSSHCEINRRVV